MSAVNGPRAAVVCAVLAAAALFAGAVAEEPTAPVPDESSRLEHQRPGADR